MVKGKTIAKWACLALLLAYSVWVVIWAHAEASRHVCRNIDIAVDARPPMDSITRQGVLDVMKLYPSRIIGVPIDQIDTRAIERYLDNLNTFETVNCMVSGAGTIHIQVSPMIPVMRVFFGDSSYYINKDGKTIASNAEFFSDVPVVSGNFNHRFRPQDVLPLVRFVESDSIMSDLTSMIVANSPHNLLIVPKVTGHVVNFGDTTRLLDKRNALLLFYHRVMPHKGWELYDTISVKYRGQVIATRRDKTRPAQPVDSVPEEDIDEATLQGTSILATTENTERTDE